jgi:NAD(P)-dependent dehydrogenase (short-subunit alcohol dehydrogenase family)
MTYLPALHTSSVALRQMVASKVQNGRIVFVSSFLGMAGIVGYNGYCGGKYAIRGESSLSFTATGHRLARTLIFRGIQ